MYGFTESLNISVAVAIILQHVTNKLKVSDVDWQLQSSEKREIYERWVRKTIKNVDMIVDHYLERN